MADFPIEQKKSRLLKLLRPLVVEVTLQMIFVSALFAQQLTVKGTVKDLKTGEPLPAANVLNKSTGLGTITQADGTYRIDVASANAVLTFSSVGYRSQDIVVNGRTEINVRLETSMIEMDEVVTIGYGTARRSDLTGAVSFMSA